ncbi:dihydroneopterin aldolase [Gracilimonas amylolytica]|uniref:dihydroneopterin aldolase n=1 Tax=Gracilimonas amylolytica TaxID=1749045 RepID=UPI000CD91AE5|nr:dihydroneopterin aldolase [Gracilimonas amylolytica]
MDILSVNGMKFLGYHGVQEFEKEEGNEFIVDVFFHTDLSEAGVTDDLNKAINYTEVQNLTSEIMEGASVDLIETLCYRIGNKLYEEYEDQCEKIVVKVRKLKPPIEAPVDHTEAHMSWPR